MPKLRGNGPFSERVLYLVFIYHSDHSHLKTVLDIAYGGTYTCTCVHACMCMHVDVQLFTRIV